MTKYEPGDTKRTLNSSESLDNLESIYEPVRTYTTAAACFDGYLSELSGCQEIVMRLGRGTMRNTFCCLSLSSPRPEKSVRKSAIMLSTISTTVYQARGRGMETKTSPILKV